MLKRIAIGIIVALLTAVGVVIPSQYVDKFVTLFIPEASAMQMMDPYPSTVNWLPFQYGSHDLTCTEKSGSKYRMKVEALRPSSLHYSNGRSGSNSELVGDFLPINDLDRNPKS